MTTNVNCPSCGGPVVFTRNGSLVAVCDYCRSVVARRDRDPESLGKVAALVETDSPLKRGLNGRYERNTFNIAGHIQIRHAAGGLWDEWLLSFDDGSWAWLAEAQGKFYLTRKKDAAAALPPAAKMKAGATGKIPGIEARVTVREVGEAEYLGAEGELPFRLTPGERYAYADLAGADNVFATIDYSDDPPSLYTGREVALESLGIAAADMAPRKRARVSALSLSCPRCGGVLQLRAPDRAARVTCPNCNSQLDVDGGKLAYLYSLDHVAKPTLPLGTRGTIDGVPWELIGYMQRSTVVSGTRYRWDEYLLYNVTKGFRWLVCSDGHWNYVEPVEGVNDTFGVSLDGRSYRHFQSGIGTVDYVLGEFYWKVEIGERVGMDDYIAPPFMLSRELATTESSSEVNWSRGRYMTPSEVGKAFSVRLADARIGVGPNQPFMHDDVYRYWAIALVAMLLVGALIFITAPRQVVADFRIDPPAVATTATVVSPPFQLTSQRNLQIEMRSNVDNSWTYVEGDVFEQKSGIAYAFGKPIEYWHGYDDGKWSEGKKYAKTYLSSIPPGQYSMRVDAQWPNTAEARSTYITVRSGVPRVLHFALALLFISLFPLGVVIYQASFEAKRWENSSFGTSSISADDEDE